MMNSVAPFWDGNETWLVLGGGGLWVAFPQAYAVIMPAFYLPVIVMLLALVFRGVAFEFRWVAATSKRYWNFAFAGGSTLAGFCQGVILGGLIQGVRIENGAVRRRRVRLGDAVCAAVRAWRRRRLCAARRHLAGDEDRRRGRRPQSRARQDAAACRARRSWAWSACGRRSRSRASPSAGSHCRTFSISGRCRSITALIALAAWRWLDSGTRHSAVPRHDRPVPARLSRARDLDVPLSRAAVI